MYASVGAGKSKDRPPQDFADYARDTASLRVGPTQASSLFGTRCTPTQAMQNARSLRTVTIVNQTTFQSWPTTTVPSLCERASSFAILCWAASRWSCESKQFHCRFSTPLQPFNQEPRTFKPSQKKKTVAISNSTTASMREQNSVRRGYNLHDSGLHRLHGTFWKNRLDERPNSNMSLGLTALLLGISYTLAAPIFPKMSCERSWAGCTRRKRIRCRFSAYERSLAAARPLDSP